MKEEPRIQDFRKALNEWKRETFFTKLVNETDEDSIPRRIKEAHQMFQTLTERLEKMQETLAETKQTGGDQAVSVILNTLGPKESWTEGLLDEARSALLTDLYEYPLTFNKSLIDQFKGEPNFPTFE